MEDVVDGVRKVPVAAVAEEVEQEAAAKAE